MELSAGRGGRQNARSMGEPRQQPFDLSPLGMQRAAGQGCTEPSCVPASGGMWEATLLSDNGWL